MLVRLKSGAFGQNRLLDMLFLGRKNFFYHIDGIDDGVLRGWVCSKRAPDLRYRIETYSHPQARATMCFADIYRADVQQKHSWSDGYCGFRVAVRGKNESGVRVVAVGGRERHLLATIRSINDEAKEQMRLDADLIFAARLEGSRLVGWVASTMKPYDRRHIELEVDGEVAFVQVASLYQPKALIFNVDEHHGFSIPIPRGGRIRCLDSKSGCPIFTGANVS